MRNKRFFFFPAFILLILPVSLLASGFGFYDANAKVMSMGGAFVARADDASAIYYNPAGIGFLEEGHNILLSYMPIQPHVEVSYGGQSTDSEQRWIFLPSMFYATSINENVKVGFGLFTPIALGYQYPESYNGSAYGYRSLDMAVFMRPTIAYKVDDNFSIGAGIDFVYSRMKIWTKTIVDADYNAIANTRTEFDGNGIGFSFGALYKINEKTQIGAKYRHEVEIDLDGTVDFTYYATGNALIDNIATSILRDQNLSTSITIPGEVTVGFMYKANEDWTFQGDFVYTMWSSAEEMTFDFQYDDLDGEAIEQNWDDSFAIKFGAEYWLNFEYALRFGFIRDQSPVPDDTLTPYLPDGDRNEFTVGLGYDTKEACCWGRFFADIAFRYSMLDDRTSTFPEYPAAYSSNIMNFGISVGLNF